MLKSLLLTSLALSTGSILGTSTSVASSSDHDHGHQLDHTPWYLPEKPPSCTEAEADSGDVGHCLLSFYRRPWSTGFGTPPAPGVGPGWDWSGANYNGSDALGTWERDRIAHNDVQVASMWPGSLETHVEAQPLFEGFLHEITQHGYEVGYTIGYSFRCTRSNGGWDCPSGNPDHLSYHAYGLAIDMNAGANPIRSYTSQNGVTACKTPMVTDMPQWMIQAAERWGLYWGGYGFSSGCDTVDTERGSVFRDPPHFEFRGSVEQARAIAAFNEGRITIPDPNSETPTGPTGYCFDVIDSHGHEVIECADEPRPQAGWRLAVDTEAPTGTTAAMLNLTVTESGGPGYLTLEDCDEREAGPRSTSALTFGTDDTIAAMAVVPLDSVGRFCVYHSVAAHSVVDILGYIGADGEALWFDPTGPNRLTDTREGGSCEPLQECRRGPVGDGATHFIPTDDERPRIANIAVVDGPAPGWLQAGRCESVGNVVFSNVNYVDAGARSNLALIDNGAAGSCVHVLSETHVVVDELGALDTTDGYGWHLDAARRVLDTRECGDLWCDSQPSAHTVIELDIGTTAPGAALAITVTEPVSDGFVTVASCDTFDGNPVGTSNVNYVAGQTVTNLALVELDAGRICLYTMADAHLVVDVQAELVVEQIDGLSPIVPDRVHDSRDVEAA